MTEDVDEKRRHFLTMATAVTGGVGIAFAVVPFLGSLKPSARALALGAPVEVPVGTLEPGEMVRVMWRGRVIYVVRRDQEMLSRLGKVTDLLRDPESKNEDPTWCCSTRGQLTASLSTVNGSPSKPWKMEIK